ncbi:hypothetical protein Clole_2161 [Cellulosilyticum lentocellum DSM 5427]|uniref:Uncharacterized protein n=1 Tax=Cellulosilyticum lentocellum (strain ATCC 49066 / DSM 5427 / NCIMB 11756 / RHM5) TaxID=642492 RepID=F2JR17_CELLD|nr:hypothetical protein Clole_2161 [Cellulosilyticum lentocellum DSM 5427]
MKRFIILLIIILITFFCFCYQGYTLSHKVIVLGSEPEYISY